MKLRKTQLLLLVPALLLTQAFSCQSKVVTTEHDFAVGIAAAQKVEIAVHDGKGIPDDVHIQIQQGFLKVGAAGEAVNASMAAKASNATIVTQLQVLNTSLQSLLNDGTLGIKDPNAKAAFSAAVQGAITLTQNAIIAFGGKI